MITDIKIPAWILADMERFRAIAERLAPTMLMRAPPELLGGILDLSAYRAIADRCDLRKLAPNRY